MSFVFNKQIITDLLNTLTKSREEVKSFITKCKLSHDTLEMITTHNTYYLETGKLF